MILTGILLALVTGLFWNVSGIVNSICAKKGCDLYSYLLTNVVFTALFTGILSGGIAGIFRRDLLLFAGISMLAGVLNTSGALFLQRALQKGRHGIVFLISQASPAIPFIAGMTLLGDKPSFLKAGGVVLIFAGMTLAALPGLRERTPDTGKKRGWLLPALLSFGCFGVAHTMLALPSLMALPEGTEKYRTFLFYCGSSVLMTAAAALRRRAGTFAVDRALLLVGVIAAVLNVCSMGLFFKALDHLAPAHAVGLGSPLAVSASLAGFTLYSWFYLREKREAAVLAGLLCICAGAVAASF